MKYLCHNCVGDYVVKARIEEQGSKQFCYNCEKQVKAVALDELADWVDPVYQANYAPGGEYPVWDRYSDDTSWETRGDFPEDIISEMLEIDHDVALDIVSILSEREAYSVIKGGANSYYTSECKYEPTPISSYQHSDLWNEFCHRVKHISRFFDTGAVKIIDDIFRGIDDFSYSGDSPPIRTIGAGTPEKFVYRARRADGDHHIVQMSRMAYKEMGPPPLSQAIAGRMNPTGIPVFYGALDRQTCVSEIRLSIGGMALTAKFEIIKPLRALDLTVFQSMYKHLSMFDPEFESKISRIKFLREFEREVRKPILPADEPYDYISTQAFAEYLANHYEPKIDAVIFSSAQTEDESKNIVILSHAAAVEWPPNAQVMTTEETPYYVDWGESDCRIIKNTPTSEVDDPFKSSFSTSIKRPEYMVLQDPALRLVPDSLKVMTVKSIKHSTESFVVSFLHARDRNDSGQS